MTATLLQQKPQRMPELIKPMLAKPSPDLPADDGAYGYEIKWDGIRAIVFIETGRIKIQSRNLLDITRQYPELGHISQNMNKRNLILDGEIVALDETGRPSFSRLQHRMGLSSDRSIAQQAKITPATFIVFDILYLDSQDLRSAPYIERRRILESLELPGSCCHTPDYSAGNGAQMVKISKGLGLEGIIAKLLTSTYQAGKRTGAWLKIKNTNRQELVIGGWTPGKGVRSGRIGALLLGYYEETAGTRRLLYAGSCGTGFSETELNHLYELLQPLSRNSNPFASNPGKKGVHYVEPKLVAEFEFTEWTPAGTMRHPSYKGLRFDKPASSVVREQTYQEICLTAGR